MAVTRSKTKSSSSTSEFDGDSSTQAVTEAVQHLRSIGVNFVALDFDRTILQVHTGGLWRDSLEELQTHIRPEFAQLIQTIVQSNTHNHNEEDSSSSTAPIHLAVVTFSGQIQLIRGVLSSILSDGCDDVGDDNSMKIPIRGEDGSWEQPYETLGWWPENADVNYDPGKQAHMLSALQEIESTQEDTAGPKIQKTSTVLIDDDAFNIQVAKQNGVRAVRLYPSNPGRLFSDILRLV
jgi:hypothetical protein